MGLDIDLCTDKDDVIKSGDYLEKYFNKHSLSRTFCNMLGRNDVIDGEPELDQIGIITGIDISTIYQMAHYVSENNEELAFFLEMAESEDERQRLLKQSQQTKTNLKGNINSVLLTINELLDKVSKIDNLPGLLNDFGYDTLDYKTYFTDFNIDKGEGYIGNNFGQDLRNFKRFLEFAKDNGATTIYFGFG